MGLASLAYFQHVQLKIDPIKIAWPLGSVKCLLVVVQVLSHQRTFSSCCQNLPDSQYHKHFFSTYHHLRTCKLSVESGKYTYDFNHKNQYVLVHLFSYLYRTYCFYGYIAFEKNVFFNIFFDEDVYFCFQYCH